MSKRSKLQITIISVLVVIILLIGVGGFVFYQTSPQKTYLDLSNAIKENNSEAIAKLYDCDELSNNFLSSVRDNLPEEDRDFDCDALSTGNLSVSDDSETNNDSLFDEIPDEALANNIVEAFQKENFYRKGSNYELEIDPGSEDDLGIETKIYFVFARKGLNWKIIDIEIPGLEALFEAFSGIGDSFEESISELSEVDQEFNINSSEDFSINGISYSVAEYDSQKTIEGADFNDEVISYTAPEGQKFARILLKTEREDANQQRSIFPNLTLIDSEGEEIQETSSFGTEFEDIFIIKSSIPDEYAQIAEESAVEVEEDSLKFTVPSINFSYLFYLIDENDDITNFDLQIEFSEFLSEEGENESFRARIDLQ